MTVDMNRLPVTMADIHRASHRLEKYARVTPLIQSYYMSSVVDGEVYLKLENMQLTGSFKFRGAYNHIAQLTEEEKKRGVIACSAGNHAQGVALSCKLLGVKATIVMPETAPKAKVEATKGYGAEVILAGSYFDEAKKKCEEIASESGLIFIPPYDDDKVVAGQGTIGLEILNQLWDVDNIIVPVGGGGLIAGLAIAVKTFNPNIKVIGVQAENIHGMTASYRAKKITEHREDSTIADGCAVAVPGNLTFGIATQLVDDMVLVSEEEIHSAMKDLIQRAKIVCEGSGAMPTAAILSGKIDPEILKGKKTVALVSGGNIDLSKIEEVVDHFLHQP